MTMAFISMEIYVSIVTCERTTFSFSAPELERVFAFSASLSNIGQLAGAILTGYSANKWGRRISLMLLSVPLGLGWLVVAVSAGDFGWLVVGRMLQGVGILSSVSQVYLVEIADVSHR